MAYLAGYLASLDIINVRDPWQPSLVGTWDTIGNAYSVATKGRYAYLGVGLTALDISDPSEPTFVAKLGSLWPREIALGNTMAYLSCWEFGWSIVNIADSGNPTHIGNYPAGGYPNDIAYRDDTVYLAVDDVFGTGMVGGLDVFDVSNPVSPQLLGSYLGGSNPGGSAAVGVSLSDTLATLAFLAQDFEGLVVIDLQDPTRPEKVGQYDTPGASENVHVQNGIAFVTDGEGVQVVDVSRPGATESLGYYKTPGYAYDVFVRATDQKIRTQVS